MKKFSFLFIFFILTVYCDAQVRFGIKGGGNLSNMIMEVYNADNEMFKPGLGFQAGFMAEYGFSEKFALQSELLYVNNRIKLNKDKFNGLIPTNMKIAGNTILNQIQLPFYLKGKFPVSDKRNFYLMGGGFVNYIATAKMKLTGSQNNVSESIEWNLFDNNISDGTNTVANIFRLNRWNAGVGLEIGMEFDKIIIGINGKYVLTNMSSIRTYSEFGLVEPDTKMYTVSLSAGYFF